jgi:hypothetical protein
MSSKAWVGLLGGLSCWLVAGLCQAQCRMDNDCPGDQVCENDTCVAPQALPPAPPPPAAAAASAATTPPPAAPAAPARTSIAAEPLHDMPVERAKPLTRRHSTAMMVVGIIMTSIGPIPLFMSIGYSAGKSSCRSDGIFGGVSDSSSNCNRNDGAMYGTLALGLGLVGAGIPLIVVGSKRVPIARASLTPWAAPGAGGLSLRVDL